MCVFNTKCSSMRPLITTIAAFPDSNTTSPRPPCPDIPSTTHLSPESLVGQRMPLYVRSALDLYTLQDRPMTATLPAAPQRLVPPLPLPQRIPKWWRPLPLQARFWVPVAIFYVLLAVALEIIYYENNNTQGPILFIMHLFTQLKRISPSVRMDCSYKHRSSAVYFCAFLFARFRRSFGSI
jgi:hypothetical protein